MEEIKSKSELVQMVKSKRRELENLIESIPPSRLTETGVENDWSVKDIMAHISRWEHMMCEWIKDLQAGIIPDRPPPGQPWENLDQINASIFEENKQKPFSRVQAEFQSSYKSTLELIEITPERDLFEPGVFEWTKNNPLWYFIGGNTFWHYEEHIPSIRHRIEKWINSE
jgi:hypothetical protein